MSTMYAINTKTTEYTTTSSLSAARVFVSLLAGGEQPSAYAIVDVGHGVSIRAVSDWSLNVRKMQKAIAAAK